MRFDVNRMGEQYQGVTAMWLSSITTVREFDKVQHLKVGESVSFERGVTGPVGKVSALVVTRTS